MLSLNKEIKTFEKFGMSFSYTQVTETRPEWVQVYKQPDGSVGPMENPPQGAMPVDWVLTGDNVTTSYIEAVTINDESSEDNALPVVVISTPDGPILSILHREESEYLITLDPCVVQFNERNGSLRLAPIFNVYRKLLVLKTGVRAMAPPSELLLAAYPGFLVQNRMGKFQMKIKE